LFIWWIIRHIFPSNQGLIQPKLAKNSQKKAKKSQFDKEISWMREIAAAVEG